MNQTVPYLTNTGARGKGFLLPVPGCCASAAIAIISAVMVFLTACSQDSGVFSGPDALSPAPEASVTTVLDISDSRIGSLDVFVFNDDSTRRLDSCQRIEMAGRSTVSCASRGGRKIIAVAANMPGDWLWEEICSYEALQGKLSCLEDETLSRPVMSGAIHAAAGANVAMSLEPLMSAVRIGSLSCDFSARPYKGERLTNVRAYLVNVSREAGILYDSPVPPVSWLNSSRTESRDSAAMKEPSLICPVSLPDIGPGQVRPGVTFYCYPNEYGEEALGRPRTRLVIEGEVAGRKYYYPINIKIGRNTLYTLDISITRTGSDDPDTAVESGTMTLRCSVAPWEEMDRRVINF